MFYESRTVPVELAFCVLPKSMVRWLKQQLPQGVLYYFIIKKPSLQILFFSFTPNIVFLYLYLTRTGGAAADRKSAMIKAFRSAGCTGDFGLCLRREGMVPEIS